MTITITQRCNKCQKERTILPTPAAGGQKTFSPQESGWRQFGNRDVCTVCLNEFVEELS